MRIMHIKVKKCIDKMDDFAIMGIENNVLSISALTENFYNENKGESV